MLASQNLPQVAQGARSRARQLLSEDLRVRPRRRPWGCSRGTRCQGAAWLPGRGPTCLGRWPSGRGRDLICADGAEGRHVRWAEIRGLVGTPRGSGHANRDSGHTGSRGWRAAPIRWGPNSEASDREEVKRDRRPLPGGRESGLGGVGGDQGPSAGLWKAFIPRGMG